MKTGFLGLGTMGKGMCLNAAKGDWQMYVHTSREQTAEECRARGITVVADRAELAECEVLLFCLPDTAVVEEILLGEKGLLPLLKPGTIIADCSTINYFAAMELNRKCAEAGISFLDCPVSGQKVRADAGTLTIMCGGDEEAFLKIKPILDQMGTNVLYMGPSGSGQLTKMINNCCLDICAASFCELMPVGVKLGLSAEKLASVIMTGTGRSFAAESLLPKVLEGNFDHDFTMAKAYKDLTGMFEITGKYALPLPTLYGTMQTYQLALQNGQGDKYKGAMIRYFEEMLGVECRKEKEQ